MTKHEIETLIALHGEHERQAGEHDPETWKRMLDTHPESDLEDFGREAGHHGCAALAIAAAIRDSAR